MFSQVFVCPQVGLSGRGVCLGGLCPGGRVSVQVVGSLQGVLCQGDPLFYKERWVCILLECILVFMQFSGNFGQIIGWSPTLGNSGFAPVFIFTLRWLCVILILAFDSTEWQVSPNLIPNYRPIHCCIS